MATAHLPVLLDEVLTHLTPQPGDRLLDATIGHGGHAQAYLRATAPSGHVVGLDADSSALAVAAANLAEFGDRVQLHQMNFAQLKDSDDGGGILQPGFTHVLFDLGIGSHQLGDATRGFSFSATGSLSMRYGDGPLPPARLTCLNRLADRLGHMPDADEIIAGLAEDELADVIYQYGEERYSRRIARAIKTEPLATTSQALAQRIAAALPGQYERGRIHPATRTFQALRLAVNRELEVLETALPAAVTLLAPQGKIAVISFHSLEDRIVKYFFRDQAKTCVCPPEQPICTCEAKAKIKILTKKAVRATEQEIAHNPRARSAKLRVAQKLGP